MADLAATRRFMVTHARLLDRRRFALLLGEGRPEDALEALEGYRNADGGYGWGLEPDLRGGESQPAGALHAFEVLEDVAPLTSPHAERLCDWLDTVSLPGGALPFALPVGEPAGTAPWWAGADPTAPSIQITAAVAAAAWRVASHDAAVAGHGWLARATSWCLDEIEQHPPEHAYEVRFALALLDAAYERDARAPALLDAVAARIPPSGAMHVDGGLDDEYQRPLDFAPLPGRPVRAHLDAGVVEADLDRLDARQGEHGGWEPEWASFSPQAPLEWAGNLTVRAIALLRANGRLA